MIIFDLDGTLADCDHRRNYVERNISCDHWNKIPNHPVGMCDECKKKHKEWKPNWKDFFEACNEDTAIWPVVRVIESLGLNDVTLKDKEIQIWSGRCESVRDKTVHWLKYIIGNSTYSHIKMRPVGDCTPDDVLKEKWLDEVLSQGKEIDFIFDDRPKVIRMFRRRGIFVFNCCQHDEEF